MKIFVGTTTFVMWQCKLHFLWSRDLLMLFVLDLKHVKIVLYSLKELNLVDGANYHIMIDALKANVLNLTCFK